MNPRKALFLCQKFVGASDLITGLLLIFAPISTLHLMQISTSYQDVGLLSFVGAFVFAVGLSYFLVPSQINSPESLGQWKMQWKVSGIVRLSIGLFITYQLLANHWDIAWISVAISDLAYAALQFYGLKAGWLRKVSDDA